MARGWRTVDGYTVGRGVVFQFEMPLTDRVAVLVEKACENGRRDEVDVDRRLGGLDGGIPGTVAQVLDNGAEQGGRRWSDLAVDEGGRRRAQGGWNSVE